MNDDHRRGKDEMNLAVLPIAKLGRTDDRNIIEYYGTFSDKDGKQEMVWKVRAAEGLGLPNELGERVLVALLYLASQDDFARRKMEFTTKTATSPFREGAFPFPEGLHSFSLTISTMSHLP